MTLDTHTPNRFTALTDRLAAEFGDLPPATVGRCVEAAGDAVRYLGEDPADFARIVERIAREDCRAISSGDDGRARVYGIRSSRRGGDDA